MKLITIISAGLVSLATSTVASPINAPGTFTPTSPIVDFENFAVGTSGPITVGQMTVSATGQVVRAQSHTQHTDIFEGQYFGFSPVSFTIDFAVDMISVGFGLFDANYPRTIVQAYDRNNNLLESLLPPTGPPGGTHSSYVGFTRAAGDIASILVTPQSGDLLAVDNIAWETAVAPIPVPASIWFMIAGLGGIAGLRRSRKT